MKTLTLALLVLSLQSFAQVKTYKVWRGKDAVPYEIAVQKNKDASYEVKVYAVELTYKLNKETFEKKSATFLGKFMVSDRRSFIYALTLLKSDFGISAYLDSEKQDIVREKEIDILLKTRQNLRH